MKKVLNYIGGEFTESESKNYFSKLNPANSQEIAQVVKSSARDVERCILPAQKAQKIWGQTPAVKRGEVMFEFVKALEANKFKIAETVAHETGKSVKDALGETLAAVSQGYYMAGEGARMFGRTVGSSIDLRSAAITKEPVGLTALIVAFNTPIANIAWKVFPSLIAGNAAILKASEDTPMTAQLFAEIFSESHFPKGILTVLHGMGKEVGAALVANKDIQLVSFTGSTEVGRQIAQSAGSRLAKTFLELGGKNPMVICDDADLENAVKWANLSSFSNAGQRCAASSRIIVFDSVYDKFKKMFLDKAHSLKVGTNDSDDFGPVINERAMVRMLSEVQEAQKSGAALLIGGKRLDAGTWAQGFFVPPTVLENASVDSKISKCELFGPITCLYKVKDLNEALELANDCDFGLTSAIHTGSYHRAIEFSRKIQAGVCSINAGTHGSEPHMPFGGVKDSGTGGREPGPEAIDVYTQLKVTYHNTLAHL
jgi:aldehyde dehydrogenase (NAD+)